MKSGRQGEGGGRPKLTQDEATAVVLSRLGDVTDNDCWCWHGYHRKKDLRPIYSFCGQRRYVYDLMYEILIGPIPAGMVLHHECENPWCVNPWQLEPKLRGAHAVDHGQGGDWGQGDKTHCPAGHEYTVENTYVYVKGSYHERQCRKCQRETKRRYRERRNSSSRG